MTSETGTLAEVIASLVSAKTEVRWCGEEKGVEMSEQAKA